MANDFDVIIVGARCAGSPLATLLARRGLKVCVVDRSRFPSEVPSTHMIHPSGVARLEHLGVLDRVQATGAPPFDHGGFIFDDVRVDGDAAILGRFPAPWLCVRRVTLDSLLIEMAEEAGAHVRTQTAVVGLVEEDGVVRGVRTETGPILAPLVVGADGPHSAVARFTGSREYNVTPPGRVPMWGYFEQVGGAGERVLLGKIGDLGFLAMPTDGGLYLAGVAPSFAERGSYLADVERGFARGIAQVEELVEILTPATRVGPIRVMSRWHGYFREAAGPGWVLVGDAGHFKDPTPAQGISDALRQAESLAPVIHEGLAGGDLAGRLSDWWRWRDEDAWEMYWFASDMGAAGPNALIVNEMIRDLGREPDGPELFLRVLNRDVAPSKVFTTRRAIRTLSRVAAERPRAVPQLVSEVRALVAAEVRQRRLRRRPDFEARGTAQEAVADVVASS